MRSKYSKFLKTNTGRYLIVGVSIYVLELMIIVIAQKFGANTILAVGISYWTGFVVSFWAQKLLTFRDKRMHKKVLFKQVFYASALVLFNFYFTIMLAKTLGDRVPAPISRTIALGATTIWNFYLYKTRIFGDNELPPIE